MAFRFKTLVIALVALMLAVPTGALAKGKPSWAGQGGSGGGHGKPAWAGQGNGKADKAEKAKGQSKTKAAHEKKAKKEKQNGKFAAADEEDADDPDELSLDDLEALEEIHAPGQYCHALESFQESLASMWGGDSFDERFGENANLANSFGKCASWRAQGGSLEEDEAEEQPAEDEASEDEDEASEEPAEDSCEPAEDEDAAEEGSDEEASEGDSDEQAEDCEAEDPADDGEQADEDEDEEEESEGDESEEDGSFMSSFDLARLGF